MQSKTIIKTTLYFLFMISSWSYSLALENVQNNAEIEGNLEIQKNLSEKEGNFGDSNLKVVGSDFFAKEGAKFLNSTGADLGIQPDYILKSDDIINIDVWGELDLHYSLTINKEGYIIIPKIGKVELRGMTYEEGKKKILNKLADSYSFYIDKEDQGAGKAHVDITLAKVSGVKVYLTGEVVHPGVVILNGANSSVISAIAAAGGLKDNGSVRDIQITNTDGSKSTFDLYDFLLKGKLSEENRYIGDGAVVFVPVRKSSAYVLGAVNNPGLYEITPKDSVESLTGYAGSLSSQASGIMDVSNAKNDVNEEKSVQNTRKEGDFSSLKDIEVKDRDIILAKEIYTSKPYSYINVTGDGIRYNGILRYESGQRISDYIKKSGGLYRDAYKKLFLLRRNEDGALFYKLINTQDALEGNKEKDLVLSPEDTLIVNDNNYFFDKNYAIVDGYFKNPQILKINRDTRLTDLLNAGTPSSEADLSNAIFFHNNKPMIIDLSSIIDNPNEKNNFVVTKFDKLELHKKEPFVEVSGGVMSPGFYPYKDDETAGYYIDLAGGFTGNAQKYETSVISISGKKIDAYFWLWLLDPVVKRGSKIIVPVE